MSFNNLEDTEKIKNLCNHDDELKKARSLNKSYFYCFKCNHLLLIDNNKTYNVCRVITNDIQGDNKNDKTEFDPIITIKNMLQRQDEQIKDINDKLVLNFSTNSISDNNNKNNYYINEKINESNENINNDNNNNNNNNNNNTEEKKDTKIKSIKRVSSEIISIDDSINKKGNSKITKLIYDEEIFNRYCEQRNKVLIYIHKLCTKLKYNDNSFYITLYLSDTYLSRIFTDDISEKELFLVVLGFFLISSKYIEDDIFEPEFQIFCNLLKTIEPLNVDEIRMSEVQCLTLINYNLYIYSVYDWLNMLLNNGVLFENEIKDIKEIENIFNYSQKILTIITSKIFFCKYTSVEIAFSIIQLSREKYLPKNTKNEKLYNLLISLYGIELYDYEECYNEIKKELDERDEIEEDENEENNSQMNINENNENINANSLDVNIYAGNSKTLNKERKNYPFKKPSRKNRFRISVDSNKRQKYIKTDINLNKYSSNSSNKNSINKHNLISSLDYKSEEIQKRKYKLKNNNYNYNNLHNNSIGILDNHNYTPNIISNNKNNSLNNTSVKSYNYNSSLNKKNHLMIDCYRNINNGLLGDKNQKSDNMLYINYAPKFLIKNIGTNINFINNISIGNDKITLNSGNNNKIIKSTNNSNLNFGYKIKNNRNNEIRSNTNHILRKTLFNLENIVPIQLNYEYNLNNINNNKIKIDKDKENANANINKFQNIIPLNNNNLKKKFKNYDKLNPAYKEKFKSHLLLEISNNPNLTNLFKNITNNATVIPANKETKSYNKYTVSDNNNKKNNLMFNKNQNNMNNINLNKENLKSKKMTFNFKDFLNKKLNSEHINKFILNNNKENAKRFHSLNSNYYIKENNNNIIENKIAKLNEKVNSDNNYDENNNFERNKNLNEYSANSDIAKTKNSIMNYKNVVLLKSKLPKLKFNKNYAITNK